jgi:hypothetical protein
VANCKANFAAELEKKLKALGGERLDAAIPEVLEAGAEVLYSKLKESTERMIKDGSGELVKALKITKVKTSKQKNKYIAVEFSGYDKTRISSKNPEGVPNAIKAMVFERGGNGEAGKGFMRRTEIAAADQVNDVMARKLDEFIKKS